MSAGGDRVWRTVVEFGDCDPAGIVFAPNFHRWMDAASRHWFVVRGIASWRDAEAAYGIVGTPIVDTQTKFLRPAHYGDALAIETDIVEWRTKSFVQRHRIRRGDELLVEAAEVRVFVARGPGGAGIRGVAPPDAIRALA